MAHPTSLKDVGDLNAKYLSSVSALEDLNLNSCASAPTLPTAEEHSALKTSSLKNLSLTDLKTLKLTTPISSASQLSNLKKSNDDPPVYHAPVSTTSLNLEDSKLKTSSLKKLTLQDLSLQDLSLEELSPANPAPTAPAPSTFGIAPNSIPSYLPASTATPPALSPESHAPSAPPAYEQTYSTSVSVSAPEPSAPPATQHLPPSAVPCTSAFTPEPTAPPATQYFPPSAVPTSQPHPNMHHSYSYSTTNMSHNYPPQPEAYTHSIPNYPPSTVQYAQNAQQYASPQQHYPPVYTMPFGYPAVSGAYQPAAYASMSTTFSSGPGKENYAFGAAPPDVLPSQYATFTPATQPPPPPPPPPPPGPPPATSGVPLVPPAAPVAHAPAHQPPSASVVSPALAAPTTPGVRQLPAVGGFKDMGSSIKPVRAVRLKSGQDAANRLVDLKRKLNELQCKRGTYHAHLAGNAGGGAVAALFTGGASLLVTTPAAIHQRNRVQQILKAMKDVILQINLIRDGYSHLPGWGNAEAAEIIEKKVFTNGLKRNELKGDL